MHEKIWNAVRERLKDIIDEDSFERWVSVIQPSSFENGRLTLAVENEMLKIWIENNFLSVITETLVDGTSGVAGVELVVDENIAFASSHGGEVSTPPPRASSVTPRRSAASKPSSLNPAFTFAEFIEGQSNSYARAAALAVAANPGRAYNPLLIYGDTGLGKTHLMQAIAHGVLAHTPKASVCYLTAEAFMNDFIESIQNAKMPDFRARYRNVDVLLMDDIHFFTRIAEKTQEEFFHTYNVLHNAQKQIVLTSDRPLHQIQGLEARLVSRFQQGLGPDISKPDFETRVAILRYKQRNSEFKLPDNLLNFIGENITSNVRQLEGALVKAASYGMLSGKPLTVDTLGSLLDDMIDQERRPELTFTEIQKIVADDYNVRVSDLSSKERPQSVALPRQIAMFLCRRLTSGSLPEIAKAFDKTHATIVHACKAIPDRMETDPDLKRRVCHIVERLGRDSATLLE